MNPPRHPAQHPARGFSLIEVALALGVAAISLTAILGLFPTAVETAREARRETRATFIAQSVLSDLRAGDPAAVRLKSGPGDSDFTAAADLTTASGTKTLAFDDEGSPLAEVTANFDAPVRSPADASYGARVAWEPAPSPSRLIRLTVTVETPLAAPAADRRRYPFTTLLAP